MSQAVQCSFLKKVKANNLSAQAVQFVHLLYNICYYKHNKTHVGRDSVVGCRKVKGVGQHVSSTPHLI